MTFPYRSIASWNWRDLTSLSLEFRRKRPGNIAEWGNERRLKVGEKMDNYDLKHWQTSKLFANHAHSRLPPHPIGSQIIWELSIVDCSWHVANWEDFKLFFLRFNLRAKIWIRLVCSEFMMEGSQKIGCISGKRAATWWAHRRNGWNLISTF